ncbi:hypothetical protein OC842_002475 [Tilletia horrida]|uniref:Uncharacterized protein n=1 Tax=Tilletia horrida TaxID=155126 RepID=A0AAN6GD87_9BASI|nr:hypothetical protein OC842_002475 [Tilletia horrida]
MIGCMILYRLIATASALAALASALPQQLSSRQATAGNSCNTDADCGPDAPACDFPWLEKVAPYNSPAKVCQLLPRFRPCSDSSQCSTGLCDSSSKTCDLAFPSNKCAYNVDCTGFGLCGTAANVLSDGTTMAGICLRPAGWYCVDNAECQSGSCINGQCGPDDKWGLGNGGGSPCGGDYAGLYQAYIAASELPDGSFALSPNLFDDNFCGPKDARADCTQNSDCISGLCIDMGYGSAKTGMATKSCGLGWDVGTPCSQNWQCHTGRCAFTKNSTTTSWGDVRRTALWSQQHGRTLRLVERLPEPGLHRRHLRQGAHNNYDDYDQHHLYNHRDVFSVDDEHDFDTTDDEFYHDFALDHNVDDRFVSLDEHSLVPLEHYVYDAPIDDKYHDESFFHDHLPLNQHADLDADTHLYQHHHDFAPIHHDYNHTDAAPQRRPLHH